MKVKTILVLAILMCFAIFTATAATNYYQCWIASGGGVTCQNLSGGHYSVTWSTSTDWVAGKGWNPCNSANIQWTGGCTGCNYFGVYGWLSTPITEYYIGRGGGSSAGSYTTSKGSYTLNSYSCNGANITGNGAFTQFNCSGSGTSPINLAEHFQGWKNLGKQVTTQNYCMVASEAWSGSGNSDVTVSEASASTTTTSTASTTTTTTTSSASTTTTSSSCPTLGDTNANGTVDIVDALQIAQYYVGLNPSSFNLCACDTNRNGACDITDALLIAQCYVGLRSCTF